MIIKNEYTNWAIDNFKKLAGLIIIVKKRGWEFKELLKIKKVIVGY